MTGSTGNDGGKAVQIMVPLKYLSKFWRTLEMPLTNYESNLILTWSKNCVISLPAKNQATIFAITDTKLYVLVVTLSTQDSAKLLQQLKSGFKRKTNWNKYQSKTVPLNSPNPYLDFLIDSSFQGVKKLFVLPFNANDSRIGHLKYYLPSAYGGTHPEMFLGKAVLKIYSKFTGEHPGDGFLGLLLGTLVASLLRNLLTLKGTIRVGEGTVRAGQDF